MFPKLKKKLVWLFAPGVARNNLLKMLALGALVGVVLILTPIHQAHAATSCGILNISGCIGTLIGWILYGIVYIISFIAGLAIALEVWMITIILAINLQVVNASIVQVGFSVVLAIANLGFVLGIIIVALATILRRETYGVKNILWKIVIMAILVNFALVIAAPIIGFSNSLTSFFLAKFPGGGSGFGGFTGFANGIGGLFQPQKLLTPENATSTAAALSGANGVGNALTGLNNAIAGSAGNIIGALISLLAAAICLVIMAIVLIVFMFMLLIRYIYLVFLLIVAPMAWMFWVFPKTNHYFSQWWSTFIRWVFFPPIVMFFMWLIITVGNNLTVAGNGMMTATQTTGFFSFFQNFLGSLLQPIMTTFMNDLVIIGLMIGGMYVANKMSIMGAGAAMGAATSVGNSIKGYAGKQAKKGTRATYQRLGGQKLNERLSRSKIYGVSAIGRQLSTVTEKGGKDLVGEAGKEFSGKSTERIVNEMQGRMGNEQYLAAIAELTKRGAYDLNQVKTVGGKKTLSEYMGDEKLIKDGYDQGKLVRDYNVVTKSDGIMRKTAGVIAEKGEGEKMADEEGIVNGVKGQMVPAIELLNKAAEKFFKTVNTSDIPKMGLNQIYGSFPQKTDDNPKPTLFGLNKKEADILRMAAGRGIALSNPYLVASMIGKINNKGNLQRFESNYRLAISVVRKSDPARADELEEALKRAIGNKLLFGGTPDPATAGAPAPAPAPTPPPRTT